MELSNNSTKSSPIITNLVARSCSIRKQRYRTHVWYVDGSQRNKRRMLTNHVTGRELSNILRSTNQWTRCINRASILWPESSIWEYRQYNDIWLDVPDIRQRHDGLGYFHRLCQRTSPIDIQFNDGRYRRYLSTETRYLGPILANYRVGSYGGFLVTMLKLNHPKRFTV